MGTTGPRAASAAALTALAVVLVAPAASAHVPQDHTRYGGIGSKASKAHIEHNEQPALQRHEPSSTSDDSGVTGWQLALIGAGVAALGGTVVMVGTKVRRPATTSARPA